MDSNLPSNSEYSKSQARAKEEKHIQTVVTKPVKKRKKSEARKVAEKFIVADFRDVGSYILTDILVPAFKKGICDMVKSGIDMIMWGDAKPDNSGPSKRSYVSYYNGGSSSNTTRNYHSSYRGRSATYEYEDVIFSSYGEAENVLNCMEELLERYHVVSVGDMYDLCNVTSEWTDNKYGWTDVHGANIVRIRDGYVIKMPPAKPID